jgi:hypothetical protein
MNGRAANDRKRVDGEGVGPQVARPTKPLALPGPPPTAAGALLVLMLVAGACEGPPAVPAHPTWADVAPILQGQCNHCHGATARTTGSLGAAVYRFDFYDMDEGVCGEAAAAMDLPALAAASAKLIRDDVTPTIGRRPRMPPAPAAVLRDWERETLQRWAAAPVKGPPPPGNRPPHIRVNQLPATATTQLSFVATTEDPDSDSIVGVIRLGPLAVEMDHPGNFAVRFNLASLPPGPHRLSAVLCDGWASETYDLGPILVDR